MSLLALLKSSGSESFRVRVFPVRLVVAAAAADGTAAAVDVIAISG